MLRNRRRLLTRGTFSLLLFAGQLPEDMLETPDRTRNKRGAC